MTVQITTTLSFRAAYMCGVEHLAGRAVQLYNDDRGTWTAVCAGVVIRRHLANPRQMREPGGVPRSFQWKSLKGRRKWRTGADAEIDRNGLGDRRAARRALRKMDL